MHATLIKLLAKVVKFLPESMKQVLIKALIVIGVLAISFWSGMYTGWHLYNERQVAEQLKIVNAEKKENVTNSISKSEETANKIHKESDKANELKKQQKEITHRDKSGVLQLDLPDDVVRLLNDASRKH